MEDKDTVFWDAHSKERVLMTQELAVILAQILNAIHQTNFSERFWKILLRPYISAIITDRAKLSKEEILTREIPTAVYANTLFPSRSAMRYGAMRYTLKSIKHVLKKTKSVDLSATVNIGLGFHDKESFAAHVDYFLDTDYPVIFPKSTHFKKRSIALESFTNEKYNLVFIKNITRHLPKVYVEHFPSLYDSIPVYHPKDKVIHVSFLENFYMSLWLAKYVEGGAKLFSYQHGAFYGEFPFHSAHHFESSISDQFLTWGWKMLPHDVPSFAFRLEKIKRAYQHTDPKEIDLLLMFPALNGRNNKTIIERGTFLTEHVRRDLYQRIMARPRPIGKVNRKDVLSFLPKSVAVDSGYSDLFKLISTSSIVIQMTLPSTNFLECLAIDQPTMGILDNDDPSDIVKPHYDYLAAVGILHRDVNSLVAHLNTVNLSTWWRDIVASEGYRAFKKEFLNLKSNS